MGSGHSRWSALVGVIAWGTVLPAAGAIPPESPLQLSYDLTPPAPETAAGENERTLLRLKLRAAQSGMDGTAAVQELIGRLERMDRAVADLQEALSAASTTPAPIPAPTAPAESRAPWLPTGAAGVLALIGGIWLGRRRRPQQPEPPLAVTTSTITQPMGRGANVSPGGSATATTVAELTRAPDDDASDGDLSLELADVMLSMGLSRGAAQALENHIRAHPRETLCHWLKLLDIYRHAGAQEEFMRAVADLPQHFNVSPPDWLPETRGPETAGLENYPHISARVRELWPTRACVDYLNRLLEDNRGGTRAGFPQPVAEEILLLLAILRG